MTKLTTLNKLGAFNASEYQTFFDLTEDDLSKKILDFPGGMNSFSAEIFAKNHHVSACDDIYTSDMPINQLSETLLKNPVLPMRDVIIDKFKADFSTDLKKDRYIKGSLPHLPFDNYAFDLLLCSFFLFTNSENLSQCWNKLIEMLRVSTEVRIYPITSEENLAPLLGSLMLKLQAEQYGIEIRSIVFSPLPNAGMLRIWSQNCTLPE